MDSFLNARAAHRFQFTFSVGDKVKAPMVGVDELFDATVERAARTGPSMPSSTATASSDWILHQFGSSRRRRSQRWLQGPRREVRAEKVKKKRRVYIRSGGTRRDEWGVSPVYVIGVMLDRAVAVQSAPTWRTSGASPQLRATKMTNLRGALRRRDGREESRTGVVLFSGNSNLGSAPTSVFGFLALLPMQNVTGSERFGVAARGGVSAATASRRCRRPRSARGRAGTPAAAARRPTRARRQTPVVRPCSAARRSASTTVCGRPAGRRHGERLVLESLVVLLAVDVLHTELMAPLMIFWPTTQPLYLTLSPAQ